MSRLLINPAALRSNFQTIDRWMREKEIRWTVVTKALCGHKESLALLRDCGCSAIAESRLPNLQSASEVIGQGERWFLRPPSLTECDEVIQIAEVSLNSELETIRALNQAARRHGKVHRVVIMIELGDLREGVLPGALVKFYRDVFRLKHIKVEGIGANLGCISGSVPNIDQYMQLILYRELLELKFKHPLPMISGGSSATLPLLLNDQLPKGIDHFRIGESLLLGTNLIEGGLLPGLRDDAFVLEGDILEIKKKGLVPMGETAAISPFSHTDANSSNHDSVPGQRGYRALLNIGHLDVDVDGLRPENPDHAVAGASSDITVINVGQNPDGLKVGDAICFRLSYSALLRIMDCSFVEKVILPDTAGEEEKSSTTMRCGALPASGDEAADDAALAHQFQRDRAVWNDCATTYENRIVTGHPDVLAYMGFEDDFLDRMLWFLAGDLNLDLRLYDVGCGSGRLHLRHGLRMADESALSTEDAHRLRQARAAAQVGPDRLTATRIRTVGGIDFSARMIDLARQKLEHAGLGSLLGKRLLLDEGSAFDLEPMAAEPIPVVVSVCNSIGVMQGKAGAEALFDSMRRAVEKAGGIGLISAYSRTAVSTHALNQYESTMDVCGQPVWLHPNDYVGTDYRLVPQRWKRAFDQDDTVMVDVMDPHDRIIRRDYRLQRNPDRVRQVIGSGEIRTHGDYQSNWYDPADFAEWVRNRWGKEDSHLLSGTVFDVIRGGPCLLALYDPSGKAGRFLSRWDLFSDRSGQ